MPRTRLAWHLFVTFSVAVAAVMVGCYWLASLQLARLADETQFPQMIALAPGLASGQPELRDAEDRQAFARLARLLSQPAGMTFELLDRHGERLAVSVRLAAEGVDLVDRWPDPERLLAEARAGRVARGSRYDAASGSRVLVVVNLQPQQRCRGRVSLNRRQLGLDADVQLEAIPLLDGGTVRVSGGAVEISCTPARPVAVLRLVKAATQLTLPETADG